MRGRVLPFTRALWQERGPATTTTELRCLFLTEIAFLIDKPPPPTPEKPKRKNFWPDRNTIPTIPPSSSAKPSAAPSTKRVNEERRRRRRRKAEAEAELAAKLAAEERRQARGFEGRGDRARNRPCRKAGAGGGARSGTQTGARRPVCGAQSAQEPTQERNPALSLSDAQRASRRRPSGRGARSPDYLVAWMLSEIAFSSAPLAFSPSLEPQ